MSDFEYGRVTGSDLAKGAGIIVAIVMLLIATLALLAGCASAPEKQIVSSVTSLPPVQVPVPVRCVKPIGGCVGANPVDKCQAMPTLPVLQIDPNATALQRYFQMKAALIEREIYVIDANAVLLGCATPPEAPK